MLAAATARFAAQGYDGTSIATIARELDVSKQALLHHFGTKEQLYAEVLDGVAQSLQDTLAGVDAETAEARFEQMVLAVHDAQQRQQTATALLTRELLDNHERAARKRQWLLRDFLQALVDALRATPAWAGRDEASALAAVYPLLGASNYLAISGPTLARIFGSQIGEAQHRLQRQHLQTAIRHTLAPP